MELVAQGLTSRDIGGCLFLSPRTVEMHVQNSLDKLGCRTRAEAVRRLAELGAWSGTATGPAAATGLAPVTGPAAATGRTATG
jgi:hypothetical protein